MPVAAAAPLALVQLHHDARNRGRRLLPELLGGIALGSIAAAELRAAGFDLVPAFAAWALLAAKASGAILYVRARLRRDRGLAFSRSGVAAAHGVGLLAAAAFASVELAPWPLVLAFGVLLVRSVHGLSPVRHPTRPQVVGVLEIAYGLGFLLLAVVGYRADS
jgi:hypothetical protein